MIALIRHGETIWNQQKRYIGKTDKLLCGGGLEKIYKNIEAGIYPSAQLVISSPMKRCVQTARRIYPRAKHETNEDLRECDFGEFEGKNYMELSGDPRYQAWIDSGGEMRFPGGESKSEFSERCVRAFEKIVESASLSDDLALVVHGGTIMAIMERFARPRRSYYDWRVRPGQGFLCDIITEPLSILIVREIK